MAWVAVDKFRGQEFIYEEKPVRDDSEDGIWLPSCCDQYVALPKPVITTRADPMGIGSCSLWQHRGVPEIYSNRFACICCHLSDLDAYGCQTGLGHGRQICDAHAVSFDVHEQAVVVVVRRGPHARERSGVVESQVAHGHMQGVEEFEILDGGSQRAPHGRGLSRGLRGDVDVEEQIAALCVASELSPSYFPEFDQGARELHDLLLFEMGELVVVEVHVFDQPGGHQVAGDVGI